MQLASQQEFDFRLLLRISGEKNCHPKKFPEPSKSSPGNFFENLGFQDWTKTHCTTRLDYTKLLKKYPCSEAIYFFLQKIWKITLSFSVKTNICVFSKSPRLQRRDLEVPRGSPKVPRPCQSKANELLQNTVGILEKTLIFAKTVNRFPEVPRVRGETVR